MINAELLHPRSIAIVGASNDTSKPGGKVLKNILAHEFSGALYGVNPNERQVQGVPCFGDCAALPDEVDLAIIAVPAPAVPAAMEELAFRKSCKAFILFSAGFSEIGPDGKLLEERCAKIAADAGATLIGPNCIGIITGFYKGVFAGPIPHYDPLGIDCASASGATMVYLLEMAIPRGLKFRDIFSVGNSAQVGIEDILEYWDLTFDESHSSRVKLLYMEGLADPRRFLKHARSLVRKGCRIAAIKAGSTEAGSRAVMSHTGALAGSDAAINALFRKAGIIRCYSRKELVYVAAIFSIKPLQGDRIAVITHAGGPGVMLTDILTKGGMKVPNLQGPKADALLAKLHPGSSVANPIDFLATGNAKQLAAILDTVENDFEEIDGAVVVFGTTGMWRVDDVYDVLHTKINQCSKPIFPILPSTIQAADEVSHFQSRGHVNFMDEVSFGYVLTRVNRMSKPHGETNLPAVNRQRIREIIAGADKGFLPADTVFALLRAAGIRTAEVAFATSVEAALERCQSIGFPLVMKVAGPVHKTDVGGVVTGIGSREEVSSVFEKLMHIKGAEGVILQQQLSGIEVYIGCKAEPGFGHLILCGLGGIHLEVFKDISSALAPVSREEALTMIRRLKSYPIIRGVRGKAGLDEAVMADAVQKVSALIAAAPEIQEMDINPLMGSGTTLIAVDARIRL